MKTVDLYIFAVGLERGRWFLATYQGNFGSPKLGILSQQVVPCHQRFSLTVVGWKTPNPSGC